MSVKPKTPVVIGLALLVFLLLLLFSIVLIKNQQNTTLEYKVSETSAVPSPEMKQWGGHGFGFEYPVDWELIDAKSEQYYLAMVLKNQPAHEQEGSIVISIHTISLQRKRFEQWLSERGYQYKQIPFQEDGMKAVEIINPKVVNRVIDIYDGNLVGEFSAQIAGKGSTDLSQQFDKLIQTVYIAYN